MPQNDKKVIVRSAMLSRFGTVSRVAEINQEERSFEHIISSEKIDSHGSIIKLSGWDLNRYKDNPVVFFGHDSRSLPVGQSMRVWRDRSTKTLMSRTRFAGNDENHELAETMFKLATASPKPFLRGWSVGFMPKKWHERTDIDDEAKSKLWDPYVYTEQELWEYSLVPLPSNTDAITAARSAGIDVMPFIKWIAEDPEMVKDFCEAGICLPGVNDGVEVDGLELIKTGTFTGNQLQLTKGYDPALEGRELVEDEGGGSHWETLRKQEIINGTAQAVINAAAKIQAILDTLKTDEDEIAVMKLVGGPEDEGEEIKEIKDGEEETLVVSELMEFLELQRIEYELETW